MKSVPNRRYQSQSLMTKRQTSAKHRRQQRANRVRRQVVLGSFVMAISALTLLLELVVRPTDGGRLFMRKANELESSGASNVRRELDPRRGTLRAWSRILIQQTGSENGDPSTLAELTPDRWHFLVGNGNGVDLGDVHIFTPWDAQGVAQGRTPPEQPGTIVIGLVGSDHRLPEKAQTDNLVDFCRFLCKEFSIPVANVDCEITENSLLDRAELFRKISQ